MNAAATGSGNSPGPRVWAGGSGIVLAALLLLLGGTSGCRSGRDSQPASTPTAPAPAEVAAATDPARLAERVRQGDAEAVPAYVAAGFELADRFSARQRWVEAVRGSEAMVLEQALELAKKEARDVGWVLRDLAFAIGRSGPETARLAAVREISGRECCLRRSFLGAALAGLGDGLEEASAPPAMQVEVALRLHELAGHSDPGVRKAAQRVAAYYPVPEAKP